MKFKVKIVLEVEIEAADPESAQDVADAIGSDYRRAGASSVEVGDVEEA